MAVDHYVAFKSEQSIAQVAYRVREVAGIYDKLTFNIVEFVQGRLPRLLKRKSLEFEFYDRDFPQDDPAYVDFDPLTLHVDRRIWGDAKLDQPDARFVIAHETGHIVLHDNSAKAFSSDKSARISFADEGHSAEWQANMFAYHFLLPDKIVEQIDDFDRLQIMCDVPANLAIERLLSVRRAEENKRKKMQKIEGDYCNCCGNFSLVRSGTVLKCKTIACENVVSLL